MCDILMSCLCSNIKQALKNTISDNFDGLEEIRLRVNKPIILYKNNKEIILYSEVFPKSDDIILTLELMSDYSLYALEEELKNGYITLQGGHRVGITGKTVIDKNHIKTIKNINGLNIRISHQVIGCSDLVMNYIRDSENIYHTLIVSPPKCGKTTLLRDIIRQLSYGSQYLKGVNVGVVDERSEIGGCYKGVPQNDVGLRTDILDACPKAEGIMLLLRSMSPDVIAVDEIGRKEDIYAIEEIINAGIKIICTVHGKTVEDIKNKPELSQLMDKKIFERIVILDGNKKFGNIESIYDAKVYKKLY